MSTQGIVWGKKMIERGWQAFERYIQQVLGLDSTISSGSKFYDPGDAVTRGRKAPFPLFCDAKYTEYSSRPLKLRELRDYSGRAAELGKRMVLAVRFWPQGDVEPQDYAVIGLHDFAELLDLCTEQKVDAPRRGILSDEEEQLLRQAALMVRPGIARMRMKDLIDKLSATEVA